MKVKEIMSKDVKSVSLETSAYEALQLIMKMQISGLPVIDDKHKLVGMFTEKDILASILPHYIQQVGRFVYQENPKAVGQKIKAFHALKVKDAMRREVITIDEDTTLCEVARTMLMQKIRRLPVLNKAKEMVGIVSRGDIVHALFEEYKSS